MKQIFTLESVRSDFDSGRFIGSFLGSQFLLYYDMENAKMYLIADESFDTNILLNANHGLMLANADDHGIRMENLEQLDVYYENNGEKDLLDGIFDISSSEKSGFFIAFSPAEAGYTNSVREHVERRISSIETKSSSNAGKAFGRSVESTQFDLYFKSDMRRVYTSMLEMLNECVFANNSAYNVSLILNNDSSNVLKSYLLSKLLIIRSEKIKCNDIEQLFSHVSSAEAIPFSYKRASSIIAFPGSIRRIEAISTPSTYHDGDILIGNYLHDSISPSKMEVAIKSSVLSLGTIITGLPGTGKTLAASGILGQILSKTDAKAVIISPTEEWTQFAKSRKMSIVNVAEPHFNINFFKCPEDTDKNQFYENLSMLIASACNSGPYESSIEKCLLAAFSKVYSTTRNPDPVMAYEIIEETLIEQHGKRTNTSVRYTKHGENIKAALENLRLMLMKPQFAYNDSIDFSTLLKTGAVFDLSTISNASKPFFYALILNQVYCITESFDLNGDSALRFAICLEEAQLVFNKEEDSAATLDIKQRLQNFRKKGVGLILITHNVTDISPSIRRLLQNKLYFRQSSDIAKFASNDLIFDEELLPDVVTKLKLLEQRTCALSYVNEVNGLKVTEKSIFVKVPELTIEPRRISYPKPKIENRIKMALSLAAKDGAPVQAKFSLIYLGETMARGSTDQKGTAIIENVLVGKRYRLVIPSERRRDTKTMEIIGQASARVEV